MQDSCNGRFVALSYGNGDGDDQSFHTLLCLLGLLGAFISHFFILIQDLFAEMTGARTVPRAPSMHSIGLGLKQAFFFEGPTVKVNILG